MPASDFLPKGRKISATEKAELKARWFFGDEDWIRYKQRLDQALAFRKTIKGKPTDEQRFVLEVAAEDAAFYKRLCFFYE